MAILCIFSRDFSDYSKLFVSVLYFAEIPCEILLIYLSWIVTPGQKLLLL